MRQVVVSVLVAGLVVGCAGNSDTKPTSPQPDGSMLEVLEKDAVAVGPIAVDVSALPSEDPAGDPRQTIGVIAPLKIPVSFATVQVADLGESPAAVAQGAIARRDAAYVWSAALVAVDATALRLELTDVNLPANAELYIYSNRGEVAGPYTGTGPLANGSFWTNTLRGNEMHLQLRYSGADAERALAAVRFTIAGAGVFDDRFEMARYAKDDASFRAFCSFTAPCVENAECGGVPAAVADAQAAVAHMVFADKKWLYICSGGLIADGDASTETPYFLTANHCISRDRSAASLETYFHFTTPCDGVCYEASIRGTLGSSVVSTNSTGDYTLLLLNQLPPADAVYLPFSTTEIAYSNNADLYRISHPQGSPQAYSHHRVDTGTGTCTSWPRGSWIYSADVVGATQGGSSGSPVLNANGEIVGQLSGGCGTNLNDDCDSVNNATVDGAFASYYDEVAVYLGSPPVDECSVASDCPEDTDSCTSASCSGGSCVQIDNGSCECVADSDCETSDSCTDGACGADNTCSLVDNGSCCTVAADCNDGSDCTDDSCNADGSCSNVDNGTCSCAPAGDSCSSADECCSNKCLGKPGKKKCK